MTPRSDLRVEALGFSPARRGAKQGGFSRGLPGLKPKSRYPICSTAKAVLFHHGWDMLVPCLPTGRRLLPKAVLFCLTFSCSGFAQSLPTNHQSAASSQTPASTGAYTRNTLSPLMRIASGDLIDITIFDTPELSQKSRVDNNGHVDLIVGGNLWVAGLTPTEAALAVEARLRDAKVLRNPHVSVNVIESAGETVTVLGEVKNPGNYPLWGQQRVADAIAAAGGLTPNASHTAALTHKGSNAASSIELDGTHQKQSENDLVLLPGDRLVVNRAGIVYVLGDVGKPGGFVLDDRAPITVLQGLALAQGMNRTASARGSLIRQTTEGPRQDVLDLKKILANQTNDPVLRDGDIVYVPLNAAKDWANRGLNSIMQMAVGVVIYGRY